jgi:hypothetical protein
MAIRNPKIIEDTDEPPGLYDPPEEGEDLWFLSQPLPDVETAAEGIPPSARVPRAAALIDGQLWREAEESLAVDLAALAFDHGRLTERVSATGQGSIQRLAHAEAASLSWWTGDRIAADRLALWLAFRIGAAGTDGAGLIRTAWAARRLMAPMTPASAEISVVIANSLEGSSRTDFPVFADVDRVIAEAGPLHPVTRGAALFHLWRSLDERPDHLRNLEAAILAARVSGGEARGLPFVPIALAGFGGLNVTGTPERRLAGWISNTRNAVLSALLELDRLAVWRARAERETAGLSGRTPARLIACLAAYPMVATPLAEAETGASRAAVQRNLDLLCERGLVREVTGQGRFRVWAARV